ncbi:MAG: hypothetical protein IJ491_09785 [Clostridia bacterium]|nr:hypothetical protein [Clostridia bacterium]
MTIKEAIERVNRLIHNEYVTEEKIKWLSAVDTLLQRELVMRHEGGIERETAYTVDNLETELIAESPYDEMYILYLILKIHFFNGETELYNNAAEEYNNVLHEYRKWYVRNHSDLPTPKFNYDTNTNSFNADFFNRAMQSANGYKGEVT